MTVPLIGIETRLRTGLVDAARTQLIGYDESFNGLLQKVWLHDAADATAEPLAAIVKPAHAQAAEEELGWRLANALDMQDLVPAVARRADGAAYIEFRDGVHLEDAGITNARALERAIGPTRAQLVGVFDYLLANIDRHLRNGLYDAARGQLSLIDHGHAGQGALAWNGGSVLEPALGQQLLERASGRRVDLDPAVVEHVRERLDDAAIHAIHETVYGAIAPHAAEAATVAAPGRPALPRLTPQASADGMAARLAHLLETGGFRYQSTAPLPRVGRAAQADHFARANGRLQGIHRF